MFKKWLTMVMRKLKGKNLKDRVVLKWGDATDINYEDNTFDVTAMAFGIRNIHEKDKALIEMKRVLLPNGQLLILELITPNPGFFRDLQLLLEWTTENS